MKTLKGICTTSITEGGFTYQIQYDAETGRMYITNMKFEEIYKGSHFYQKALTKMQS